MDHSHEKEIEAFINQIKKDRPTVFKYAPELYNSRLLLARSDPEFTKLVHKMYMYVVYQKSALSPKMKELIITAVDAAIQYARGLRHHIESALDYGATKEEILEALEAASLSVGTHALSISLPILEKALEKRSKQE